jgi:hypothetical protein
MMTGSLVTNELHLCNLSPLSRDLRGMEQMEHMSTGTRATDPELDEALSRAIRQLIAEAIEAGEGDSSSAAALTGAQDTGHSR